VPDPTGVPAVLDARHADVGVDRERMRFRRLRAITVLVGIPAAFLWWRILTGDAVDIFQMPSLDPLIVMPVLFFVVLIGATVLPLAMSGKSPHVLYRPEQLDVRLSDVVGIDTVRDEVVHSLNLFLSNRDLAENLGGRARRGVLFEGGPGTGKTHTAKALAAEANVPFLFASGTSFHSSWQGGTQRRIRSYFRALRKVALKEGGAIGFIDEFDDIGMARTGMTSRATAATMPSVLAGPMCCGGTEGLPSFALPSGAGATQVAPFTNAGGDLQMGVNELLVQMQSFDEPSGTRKLGARMVAGINLLLPLNRQLKAPKAKYANILLIASTNRADSLDPALMRPGRFDQRLTFELPTKRSRRELIDHFLSRKAHDPELDDVERRDALAAITQEYSPAMLERMLDDALIQALREGRRSMDWGDVESARLVLEVGLGQPVAYTPHEKRLIATHEAGHATMAWLVAPQRRLEVLTIVKRRQALGLLAHGDREDVFTRSRTEMLGLIQIAMGGQVAEELFFGDVSTGPGGDLLYATNVAAQMVGAAGMSGSLVSYGAVQAYGPGDTNLVGRVLGDPEGRGRVEEILQQQKVRAVGLLDGHRYLVEALRDALLERHELVGHEITDVLEAATAAHRAPTMDEPAEIDLRDLPSDAHAAEAPDIETADIETADVDDVA
jgi:cell division protease FtsH